MLPGKNARLKFPKLRDLAAHHSQSVPGLPRARLEHFEEIRQFDCPHGGRRTGLRGAEATQNSRKIAAKSNQTPQFRASKFACNSALLWVGYAQSMRAASISRGRFEPTIKEPNDED
jgi:hypothetical protein